MAKFILDTDICIYWLKGNQRVDGHLALLGLERAFITFITEAELYYGAFKSSKKETNFLLLEELKTKVKTLHTSDDIPLIFGKIKAELETKGQMLDDSDLFIASLALSQKATLVTNNLKHFQRIPGLNLENWAR